MTNGEKIKAILKPRTDQIKIFSNFVEIEIQSLAINFSCDLDWWNAEYKEPTTKNDLANERHKQNIKAYAHDFGVSEEQAEKELAVKNDLGVDPIDRVELLKAMNTWDKFGNDPNEGLIPLRTLALRDRYVPYVKYDDMVNCVKGMPSVTPQEPRKGHWIECMPGGAEEWCYKCSECNFWKYKKTINLSKFDFCPNCGADMREVEE